MIVQPGMSLWKKLWKVSKSEIVKKNNNNIYLFFL